MIRTVPNEIPNPLEAAASDIFVVFGVANNVGGGSDDRGMGAVDDVCRWEKFVHRNFA
jgi:hypothetical protein